MLWSKKFLPKTCQWFHHHLVANRRFYGQIKKHIRFDNVKTTFPLSFRCTWLKYCWQDARCKIEICSIFTSQTPTIISLHVTHLAQLLLPTWHILMYQACCGCRNNIGVTTALRISSSLFMNRHQKKDNHQVKQYFIISMMMVWPVVEVGWWEVN